jgi:hypothetical protein
VYMVQKDILVGTAEMQHCGHLILPRLVIMNLVAMHMAVDWSHTILVVEVIVLEADSTRFLLI